MAEALKKDNRVYTYRDYVCWPDDERWEILGGEAYSMAPSPMEEHQSVSGELFTEFSIYLRGKKCKVYHAPFDLLLPEEGETFETVTNIVQPDIMIVCDKEKRMRRGVYGAPDLIVEILSPATASKDLKQKRLLYERFGVKEYWIADPIHKSVQIFTLGEDKLYGRPAIYSSEDRVKVGIFEDLEIDLSIIFA